MVIETLHCETCNEDFTRERRRGRKPKTCPPCKELMAEQERESKGTEASTEPERWVDTSHETAFDRKYVNKDRGEIPSIDPDGNIKHRTMIIGDQKISAGEHVEVDGLDGRFKFRFLRDQKNGKLAVEVLGLTNENTRGKFYSVNPGRIKA